MKYLITAALPYANGPLHVGHIAGAYLPADIYVRFLRKKGEDVLFVCGSDEHGAPITIKALLANKSPREIIDHYHNLLQETFKRLNISFDVYYRTSDRRHHEIARSFFMKLYEKKLLYTQEISQYYDEKYGIFLADRYIKGECKFCGYKDAYGDQCEKCGTSLTTQDLLNPVSILSGEPPILRKTTHFFFLFSRFYNWIKEFLIEGRDDGILHHDVDEWKANVMGYISGWLSQPLKDRAITRDLTWGVKVPIPEYSDKVLYVWFEAPIGYISAVYHYFDGDEKKVAEWWKNPEVRLIHFIGKDNVVFHTILFPIILKSLEEYILPSNVPANEFLNLEDKKISTSRNWAIWANEFIDNYPDRIDQLRFFLCRIMPENRDSNFKWEEFKRKINEELVGTIGNFISRFFNIAWNKCNGKIPDIRIYDGKEKEVLIKSLESLLLSHSLIQKFSFKLALEKVMNIAHAGNSYLSEMEPWRSTDQELINRTTYTSAILVTLLCEGLEPFMPASSLKLRQMLNIPDLKITSYSEIPRIIAGVTLNKYDHLFSYFTQKDVEREIVRLRSMQEKPEIKEEKKTAEEKTVIPKMVVGEVKAAEKVPNSTKLLHLKVDIGNKIIDVVAGIAMHYSPDQLINRRLVFMIDIPPKKIMGIKSEGMLLVCENNGQMTLISPEKEMPAGSRIM